MLTFRDQQDRRQHVARELDALREALSTTPGGEIVPAGTVESATLDRLRDLAGPLACAVLTLVPETRDGSPIPGTDAAFQDRMVDVALQRFVHVLRKSDLVVRDGVRIGWLVPGAGPLELRGLCGRVAALVDGSQFWYSDIALVLRCRFGVASGSNRTVASAYELLDAAAKRPLS